MNVSYVNQQTKYQIQAWRELLDQALPAALESTVWGGQLRRKKWNASLTVIFAGPRIMKKINLETRDVDSLTDVLSFPILNMIEGRLQQQLAIQDFDPEQTGSPTVMLGDIIISLDKACQQAADYGHSVEREVAFLAIHGLLHLLGYDHLTLQQEQKMLRKQRQILNKLKLSRNQGVKNHE